MAALTAAAAQGRVGAGPQPAEAATVTLRRRLDRTGLSQRSREELTSVYNLLSEAASVIEGQQMQNATPLD